MKTLVTMTAVNPGYRKVDLLKAIRSVDDIELPPALARLGLVLGGTPITFALPDRAAAEHFLDAIRDAGAEALIEE